MEDVASLRQNAPSTLLALERAVSLLDFSRLAVSQSNVWQAKAYSQTVHFAKTDYVQVVIVPADGVMTDEVKDNIETFLQNHALPTVRVTVEPFEPVLFELKVTVRVNIDEFVAEEVEKEVLGALLEHFALKNRKLGQHLYLSEVYKVVEKIQGVENSLCVLNNDDTLKLISAQDERTVIYLDAKIGKLPEVDHERYSL